MSLIYGCHACRACSTSHRTGNSDPRSDHCLCTCLLWVTYLNQHPNYLIGNYEYQPFGVSTIQVNRSADEGGITIEGPSSTRFLNQFTRAVNGQHIVYVELLQMTNGATATNFNNFHVVAAFTGVALTMTNNLTQTRLSVGAAINAISGDVPGRKMTSSLVGVLPTL